MTVRLPGDTHNTVSTAESICLRCEKKMVSRRRYEQLYAAGTKKADPDREYVRHGSKGYCTRCIFKVKPPKPRERKEVPKPTSEDQEPTKAQIWREEWEWLKQFGVSIEEAARRLDVSVETIKKYEKEARQKVS